MIIRQNKMMGYLAVTAGVGCVSSAANAAVVFYGVNAANDTRSNPISSNGGLVIFSGTYNSYVSGVMMSQAGYPSRAVFSQGADIPLYSRTQLSLYAVGVGVNRQFRYGAVSGINYVNLSFNGNDGVYEAVGMFSLTGVGGGRLIAVAFQDSTKLADGITLLTNQNAPGNLSTLTNQGATLSISAGAAMIAAVPEPSSLVLLALGATGLAARRQRKKAA